MLISLLEISCDPFGGPEPFVPKIYIDQQLLDYTCFPEGSYWIYKNTTTGAIDSSYVSSGPDSPSLFERDWGGVYIDKEIVSIVKVIMGREFGCLNTIWYYDKEEPSKLCEYMITDIDFGTSYTMITLDSAKSVNEFMDSLYIGNVNINGFEFEEVFEITMGPPDEGPANFFGRVMFAKGVGAIRREIYPGEMWELIRYRIPEK
ncbi:MAG: hypothetical protein ACPGLV_01150 [Bacteroidia bacterium]